MNEANLNSLPKLNKNFRLFLQQEFLEKCRKNQKYSLRSFARLLEAEPAFLSKILRQKRSVTTTTIERFGIKLGLSPEEISGFKENLSSENRLPEKPIVRNKEKYYQLTLDSFQAISDWYHYAILELVSLNHFNPNPRWISKILGIRVIEVQAAIERLIRLGMLKINKQGKWVKSESFTTIGNQFTTAAFRKLQKQILEKALVALEEIPMEHRDQTSMTMAIDSRKLPQAKKQIKTFRRKLCKFLQGSNKKDHVYNLGISLYPVTTTLKEKNNLLGEKI